MGRESWVQMGKNFSCHESLRKLDSVKRLEFWKDPSDENIKKLLVEGFKTEGGRHISAIELVQISLSFALVRQWQEMRRTDEGVTGGQNQSDDAIHYFK